MVANVVTTKSSLKFFAGCLKYFYIHASSYESSSEILQQNSSGVKLAANGDSAKIGE